MTDELQQTNLDDACAPQALAEERPDLFTKQQLAWLLKTRHTNGLAESGAVLKVSQKLYLNKSRFFEWFMQQKAA